MRRRGQVDCGAAPDNPLGYEWGTTVPDGSCHACEEAPEVLPRCGASVQAMELSPANLAASVGKTVRFIGVIDYSGVWCTRRGGPCACNNGCTARLRLLPRNTPQERLPPRAERIRQRDEILAGKRRQEPEPPRDAFAWLYPEHVAEDGSVDGPFADYASSEGMGCNGNDASLCCPFALDRDTHSLLAMVRGRVSHQPPFESSTLPNEYRLSVMGICRVTH